MFSSASAVVFRNVRMNYDRPLPMLQIVANAVLRLVSRTGRAIQEFPCFKYYPNVGTYVYAAKIAYDWSALILATPVRLYYDKEREIFVVRKCNRILQFLGVFTHILYGISSLYSQYVIGGALLENPGYIVSYFDFLSELSVNFGHYVHFYLHWFRLDLVKEFITAIQTSPCVKHCRLSYWKAIFISTLFCCITSYLGCMWLILPLRDDYSRYHSFVHIMEVAAKEVFWWDGDADVHPPLLLAVLGFLAKIINAIYLHVSENIYTPLILSCLFFVVSDCMDQILDDSMQPEEVLQFLGNYKKLVKIMNEFCSLYAFHFLAAILTYDSVHFFDALNSPDALWKISSALYMTYLINFFLLASKISVKTKNVKKWLWKNQNYMNMSRGDVRSLLFDLSECKLGVRIFGIFSLTPGSGGVILANIVSNSLLVKCSEQ